MKVYSLQRRRERYRIIYTWKVLENLVPNVNGKVVSKEHIRLGRLCILSNQKTSAQKFREASFTYDGPRLFNSLPKHIRDLKGIPLAKFKCALDEYLRQVPDEPQIPGYTECRRANTNEVVDMQKVVGCLVSLSVSGNKQAMGRVVQAADPSR